MVANLSRLRQKDDEFKSPPGLHSKMVSTIAKTITEEQKEEKQQGGGRRRKRRRNKKRRKRRRGGGRRRNRSKSKN